MLSFGDADLPIFASNAAISPICRRRWLQDEVLSLVSCYPTSETVADISKRLGRSLPAVYGKARRLGLSRPRRGPPAVVVPSMATDEAPREQSTLVLRAPVSDLVPLTSASSPVQPSAEAPASAPKCSKPFRLTPLGGRQTVWTPELVHRLVLLWVAGFHHTMIAEVLGLTPCGVSSKAVRVSLPCRSGARLSKDIGAARQVDAAGGPLPETMLTRAGERLKGKSCNMSGNWFYGQRGTHTSVEAKLTLHYSRMQRSAF